MVAEVPSSIFLSKPCFYIMIIGWILFLVGLVGLLTLDTYITFDLGITFPVFEMIAFLGAATGFCLFEARDSAKKGKALI